MLVCFTTLHITVQSSPGTLVILCYSLGSSLSKINYTLYLFRKPLIRRDKGMCVCVCVYVGLLSNLGVLYIYLAFVWGVSESDVCFSLSFARCLGFLLRVWHLVFSFLFCLNASLSVFLYSL